jgi:hypothetical protein
MTEQFTFGGEIVWKPTPEHIEHANLTAFMRRTASRILMNSCTGQRRMLHGLRMRFSNSLIFNSMNRTQRSLIFPMVFNSPNGVWTGR